MTYTAEYQFDRSGWVPLEGPVGIATDPYRVTVVTGGTHLTRGGCLQYRDDPGCR
ncbi:hypothetical protein [Agromyces silvae]|uniref:hypothetical protein n=1 Tax=Agromyces silvae TaxID=3388266 RepID=UPI00280C3631|nr:hypothetical protein [Agromyces protaetiae]